MTAHMISGASITPHFGKSVSPIGRDVPATAQRVSSSRSLPQRLQHSLPEACLLSSQSPNSYDQPIGATMEAPEQPAKCKVCAASILQDEIKREDDYEDDCEENDE